MKNVREPTYSFVILTAVLIAVNTVLAYLSVKIAPASANGISWFYVAVAFAILFSLWFGAYGAIAAYVGAFVGAGLFNDIPFAVCTYWALANLWQVLIPLVAVRTLEVNLSLGTPRDVTLLLIFGVLINNIAGAAWGAWTLALGGIIGTAQMGSVFSGWLIGNIIVTILIVPLVLRHLTPKIQKSRLFVKYYWE